MSGWWIYEVSDTEEGENNENEQLEIYPAQGEDLELGSEEAEIPSQKTQHREEVAA